MSNTIQTLATRLEAASHAYTAGAPLMTDAEFDSLEDELRKLDPANDVFSRVGAPTDSGWTKVTHPVPMGSLNKAQSDTDMVAWVAKTKGAILFATEKLDGISILLTYTDGKFTRAETRGNGTVGENITRNVAIMKGVPATVPLKVGNVYIRGEVVCLKSDFAAHFPGESNPRNTASGTAKRQSRWQKAKHLTVIAYQLLTPEPLVAKTSEFSTLMGWGFVVPKSSTITTVEAAVALRNEYISSTRDSIDYEIDGLVFEINDTALRLVMGAHNQRPKGAIAFKFPHDASTTVLREIKWQVGSSGRVTPVAVFDSVLLAGANVRQASLHNLSNIDRLVAASGQPGAHEGDRILVSRRNDVIPYVESFLGTNETIEDSDDEPKALKAPTHCPACSYDLEMDGEYLVCLSEKCPAQVLGMLKRWISKNGVLHFGSALVSAVVDSGMVKTIGDLYRLKEPKVAALTLDGRRVGGSAKRALDNLNARKEITLDFFVGSLGISLVGRKMVKVLMGGGIDSLSKMAKATVAEMSAIPGFGPEKARAFREGFEARRELIVDILASGVTIAEPEVVEITGAAMDGEAVCMSGGKPKDIVAAVTAQGGTLVGSVSKKTTILMLKDPTSTSAKAVKARGLGIEVIGWDDMRARLGMA